MIESRYSLLKEIIDLFAEFEKSGKNLDILSFAHWMIESLEKYPSSNINNRNENKGSLFSDENVVFKTLDDKSLFLESISHIARYHEFYSRKALKELIVNTRLEYLFLHAVNRMEKAKKTELINVFHLEYTTGMDTIRRLSANGLIDEVQYENDKRAKLLILTEKGRGVLLQAQRKMNMENKIFLTAISDNKWKKALPALIDLDNFHKNLYEKYSEKSFSELSNLIDSLKHLHK